MPDELAMESAALLELTETYLEGELSPEQEARLLTLLRASPEAPGIFQKVTGMNQRLMLGLKPQADEEAFWVAVRAQIEADARSGEFAGKVLREIRKHEAEKVGAEDGVISFPVGKELSETISDARKGSHRPSLTVWTPWAMAAGITLLLSLYFFISHSKSPALLATLSDPQGTITVERNQAILQAKGGESLRAGDIIRVGQESSVAIRYADSTQLELEADSLVTLRQGGNRTHAGKWVEIRQGSLSASVEKQPAGRPMVFATPTAQATVAGTRLLLHVSDTATQLEVEDGAVRLRRLVDDQAVTVSEGEQAVADVNSLAPLAATPLAATPLVSSITHDPPASGATILYSNDMEAVIAYRKGTLVTTPAPHGGMKSEQLPADGVTHGSSSLNRSLPPSVSNFTYSVWITDNNHPTQTYRIYIKFKNPTTGAFSPRTATPPTAAGASWTRLSGNFTSIVNQRIGEGYTQLHKIYLQAWNGATAPPYVIYYADDVLMQHQ